MLVRVILLVVESQRESSTPSSAVLPLMRLLKGQEMLPSVKMR
jgi:hypothetical protein